MILNIGLNRRVPDRRKKIEHRNLPRVEIANVDFESHECHGAVMDYVARNHPEWSVSGYCESREGKFDASHT